jgi:hypothetical protein
VRHNAGISSGRSLIQSIVRARMGERAMVGVVVGRRKSSHGHMSVRASKSYQPVAATQHRDSEVATVLTGWMQLTSTRAATTTVRICASVNAPFRPDGVIGGISGQSGRPFQDPVNANYACSESIVLVAQCRAQSVSSGNRVFI